MNLLRNVSIRSKATTMIVSVTASVLLLALAVLLTRDYWTAQKDQLEQLQTLARVIGANSTAAVAFGDSEAAEESLNTLITTPHVKAAFLLTDSGSLASYIRPGSGATTGLLTELRRAGLAEIAIREDKLDMYARVPIVLDQETIGTLFVLSDLTPLEARAREYIWIGIGVVAIAVMLAIVVSMLLGAGLSKPLSNLAATMRVIEKDKKYAERVTKRGNDEVGQLIENFNAMLEQIELRDRQLRAHRDELELQVQKRTQELVQVNASLWQAVSDLEEAKRKAEGANRAKSDFLATVSHEIRTPLNGVLGTTEILLTTELSEKQRRFGQIIHGSANNLLNIINTILDFSKIEAGRVELEYVSFSPRDVIEEVQDLFMEIAARKGLQFSTHVSIDLPRRVVGDPNRLRQILSNLVGNAVKFTEKGEISILARPQESAEGRCGIRFEVTDTGIGIPKDAHGRIFESFAQADQSTTRRFGGSGLGLTIARQLAQMMGGQLGLESRVGVGSVFWFTVDLGIVKETQTDERRLETIKTVRVLIVNNDTGSRDALIGQFIALGIVPALAANEEAAVDMLRDAAGQGRPFDVVFVDGAGTPRAAWFIGAVRADDRLSKARLVLVSSMSDVTEGRVGDIPDDTERLLKPLKQSMIFDALSSTIRSKSDGLKAEAGSGPATYDARVLLAEDNPVNREVACEAIRQLGCEVETANDGREAVDMWQRASYDLILMDWHMPQMDGLEATATIRKMERERNLAKRIPIIALTANARSEDYQRCIAVGMNDYLTKPLTMKDLRVAIERWAGKSGDFVSETPASALIGDQPKPAAGAAAPAAADDLSLFGSAGTGAAPSAGTPPAPVGPSLWDDTPPTPVAAVANDGAQPARSAPAPVAVGSLTARLRASLGIADDGASAAPPPDPVREGSTPMNGSQDGPAPEAVLDTETLAYLRSLSQRSGKGPSVLERAITVYLDSVPPVLEELRRAVAAGNAPAVQQIAHKLKSSTASLGAKRLAQHMADIEDRARNQDTGMAREQMAEVELEYQKVSNALQETLREERERCRQIA